MSSSTKSSAPDQPPVSDKAVPVGDKAIAKEAPARRGISLGAILVSFLLVAAITVAAGSTLVAMQVIAERNRLQEKHIEATSAVDNIVREAATSMKGPAYIKVREQVFAPAISYYQEVANQPREQEDLEPLPEIVAAQYYLAALQAKTGKGACVQTLSSAVNNVMLMEKNQMPPDRYPSLKAAFEMTSPENWVLVKDSTLEAQATTLIFASSLAAGTFRKLATQHPEAITFREDLAMMQNASGQLQSRVPSREEFAMQNWHEARDVMESLLRDQPANTEYQSQLAQLLVNLAALEKKLGKTNEAIADYTRAVEVRQQMVDANPEDKDLAKELAKVKSDLEKVGPPVEEASAEGAEPPAETADAPAEDSSSESAE